MGPLHRIENKHVNLCQGVKKKNMEKKKWKDKSYVWCITAELILWKCFVCFPVERWYVCVKVVILAKINKCDLSSKAFECGYL